MIHTFEFRDKTVTIEIDLITNELGEDQVNWYLWFLDDMGLYNEYRIGSYPTHEGSAIKVGYSFMLSRSQNGEVLKSWQDYYYERRLRLFYEAFLPEEISYGDWAGIQAMNGLIARLPAFDGSKEKSDYGYRIFDATGTFFQPIVFDVAITEETSDEPPGGPVGVGQADGSLEITVANGSGGYEYSLDGDTYQASSTFDELPAGDYIVYVRDQAGVIRYRSVNIPAAAAAEEATEV